MAYLFAKQTNFVSLTIVTCIACNRNSIYCTVIYYFNIYVHVIGQPSLNPHLLTHLKYTHRRQSTSHALLDYFLSFIKHFLILHISAFYACQINIPYEFQLKKNDVCDHIRNKRSMCHNSNNNNILLKLCICNL